MILKNAGPRLTQHLITEFGHRHNENMARKNRPGFPNTGHYNTWLTDELQHLSFKLYGESLYPSWTPSYFLEDTGETFGITTIPLSNQMKPFEKSESSSLTPAMKFLAKKMGTLAPVIPVHTPAERAFFRTQLYHLKVEWTKNQKERGGKKNQPSLKNLIESLVVRFNEFVNQDRSEKREIFYKCFDLLKSYHDGYYSKIDNATRSQNPVREELNNSRQSLLEERRNGPIVFPKTVITSNAVIMNLIF